MTVPINDPKLRVERRAEDVTVFEHPTLDSIRAHCLERPDLRVLYLNCLGGRHVGPQWTLRAEWRRLVHLLLVEGAPRCRNCSKATTWSASTGANAPCRT